MSKTTLLLLQAGVAVIALALWQALTTYPVFGRMLLPPFFFSNPLAVAGAVVGEYLGSAAGLGYLIQQAEGVFDVAGVFAGMFVLAAFVIVIDMLVTMVERRLLVWRPLASDARPCLSC